MEVKSASATGSRRSFLPVLGLLAAVLLLLFFKALLPGNVLFSNDGPLGAQVMQAHRLPQGFSGGWQDLNTIGFREAGAAPDVTFGILSVLGPVGFAKAYAPLALLLLGFASWVFFRRARLAPAACVLGALAAFLNSTFFSAACWGVASHAICIGLVFLALAGLVNPSGGMGWLRVVLGGLALGMAVTEGADIGAIFSLYVAAFVVYQAWIGNEEVPGRRLALGVVRVVVVAGFAAFIAAQTISVLVSTQIQGVAGTQQDTQTRQERWDFATQWSLPKRETLGLVIPGLFGFRMDTPDGGVYWGATGRDPNWYHWEENGKQGPEPSSRGFSGGGIYAGVLVVMVAFWAALQSFRKKDSVFTLQERRMLWFWVGVVVISLPLAFGRFAPFYRILYALPYFSTIRNPGKFLHPMTWALIILFAYGVHGLWRQYMQPVASGSAYAGAGATVKGWWQRVRGFDRKWTLWSLAVLGVCALGWMIYASSRQGVENYLQQMHYDGALASSIASFSFGQVGRFVLTLAVAVALMALVISGVFRGPRAKWGAFLLGLFVVVDLARANQPWIIVWDYQHKYATNPIIDVLRKKPYGQRVAVLPQWFTSSFNVPEQVTRDEQIFDYLYGIEWSQHLFLYYDIQSLDIIQMPRMPEDLMAFDRLAFLPRTGADLRLLARKWELTNTRYILGAAPFLNVMNQTLDPGQHRFRYAERFSIATKPGFERSNDAQDWTAVPDTNGPYAVFEFTGALPRAKLYSKWELETTEAAAVKEIGTNQLGLTDLRIIQNAGTNGLVNLRRLGSPAFHPEEEVMVAQPPPGVTLPAVTNASAASPGTVEFTSYAPKDIVFKAEAAAPAILLLNDRYDPNWKVLVDGKNEPLLRCNFIMRGVVLKPGTHTVEFKFEPPMGSFYVSLAAVGLGLALLGVLLVRGSGPQPPAEREPARTGPKEKAARREAVKG